MSRRFNPGQDIVYSSNAKYEESDIKSMQPPKVDLDRGERRKRIERKRDRERLREECVDVWG